MVGERNNISAKHISKWGIVGTSAHKRKTPCISVLSLAAHLTCSMSKLVSTLLLNTAIFPQCLAPKCHEFLCISRMVCPAKYCSATGKDFCKTSETLVHLEQLKEKSPFQREEPDGREEDHSWGPHVLSMSLDDQTDCLHHRLAAADKCTDPD